MSIIYVLIPIAILLTILGVYFFFWAVKTEQFQDLEKQGLSILFDEDNINNNKNQHEHNNESAPLTNIENNQESIKDTSKNAEFTTPKKHQKYK